MSFSGKYEMVSSDNFEKYLSAVGVGFAKRKIAANVKPVIEISESDDGKYTIKTSSTLKNTVVTFKPGEPFDEETADGRLAKTTVTVSGNTMTHVQKIGNLESKTTREFDGNKMTVTYSAGGVTAVRVYKKA